MTCSSPTGELLDALFDETEKSGASVLHATLPITELDPSFLTLSQCPKVNLPGRAFIPNLLLKPHAPHGIIMTAERMQS